ncbi:MAG: exodeoxyribonuclease VII large subunit [candidate division Zixibacteria bacterium]|nr:exodeoxyribonuclease VII large subunit [candidate division Zixibacteria bacterium]
MSEFGSVGQEKIYTVTEITKEIKGILEESFPTIWVEGDISNYTLHSSGHRYFSLKDENAQIRCTLWRFRGERLGFEPEDGIKVIALGSISVYERNGQYQLDVIKLIPAGLGKLEVAFQRLKEKLFQEGLFDEEDKKPIPEFPETIGLVTSPTGAAIIDIIKIIHKRFPSVRIIVNPVRVQGEGAAEEIAQAIDEFNHFAKIDVMIVGRGGGSLEDLWAFNEEIVARAIYFSEIPVISAVGHQIDFAISDFVADLRAPTPSAAAQMVVKDKEELLKELRSNAQKLISYQTSVIEYLKQRLKAAQQSYGFRRPLDLISQRSQRVDEFVRQLLDRIKNYFEFKKNGLSLNEQKLEALSPLSVLKRGYAIVRKLPELEIIKDAGSLKKEDRLEVKFFKGKVESKVEQVDLE